MKTNLRVWRHCRINPQSSNALLDYQCKKLSKFARKNEMHVIEITKIISNGKYMDTFPYHSMIASILRKKIDAILIYIFLRISIFTDLYKEFELFYQPLHVSIISLNDIKKRLL